MEFENKGNAKMLEIVSSYREQGKLSAFKRFRIWFKSLSKAAKAGLGFVLFYAIFGMVLGICL